MWSRLTQRIEGHENTKNHKENVDAFFLCNKNANIEEIFQPGYIDFKSKQIENRKYIIRRVIEVIKVIGKRGLSFRRKSNEAGYTLADDSIDHGTFLELILLISKFDRTLKAHIDNIVERSEKAHKK